MHCDPDKKLGEHFNRRASLSGDKARQFERKLSDSYLGFVSIRPVPAVPVGRTILRSLDDGAA